MAKRNRTTDEDKIQKRIQHKRGEGRGANYLPWLTIQDVPSQGLATRIRGHKTNRIHHLLSKLETDFFCLLEMSPQVIDIREQYPLLPLEETLTIAEICGIRHPTDPKTQRPIVMTTDFLITRFWQGKQAELARSIKYCQDLASKRTLEKLEVERRYWQSRQVDWGIVTEKELPLVLVQNCRLLRDYLEFPVEGLSERETGTIFEILTQKIERNRNMALRQAALECDCDLGLARGASLAVAYHLIATRRWGVDWQMPVDPGQPLAFTFCQGGAA